MSSSSAERRPPAGRQRGPGRGPVLVLATLFLAGIALLAVAHLSAARRHLLLAQGDLKASRAALSQRDDNGASARLDRAAHHLAQARAEATSFPLTALHPIPLLGSPGRATVAAARAGLDGVAAGRGLVAASSSFPTSASAAIDGHDLTAFHTAAVQSQAAVGDAERHLADARAALEGPAGAALPPVSGPARTMRTEVDRSRTELDGVSRGLALLADLTGPTADARLLLLSQDSLELRPTGGYIGSYGVLRFDHGTVDLETYAATEDLPAPVPPVEPPPGLARYLPSFWGLSNANWWPDYPTSAAAAAEMYRRQGGGAVDGVLALTQHATARLVGALGSLTLPGYATPVVEKGFDERVVYEVELKRPQDDPRKKFLVELSTVLFDRIFHLPADRLPAVADAVRASLGAGDIQLWFRDPARERQLAGTAIAGRLPRTEGDFLMVVDAEMAASKANADVTKLIDYRVDRDKDGRLVGHVRIEVHNDGPKSPVNPLYNGYLRVYAPAGSRLLPGDAAQGDERAFDGPYEVFSQALVVEPKTSGVATFDYVLPDQVAGGRDYRLTWVRQVGTPGDRLRAAVEGRTSTLDTGDRVLTIERPQQGGGLMAWLRQRWVVSKLRL